MKRYKDKAVAITGGGSGLGAAMAERFAAEEVKLALFDIDQARVESAAADLRARGFEAFGAQVDVATADHAVRNLLAELDAGSPYIITHGSYRHQVEAQQRTMLAAFDAMATHP
ncbi:MAG: hypothetical protein RLZZ136_1079 [Pseudomonadota bacterium]|jgi:NADP-dependent 3-hydroxy acid dehydrogenase YdfG